MTDRAYDLFTPVGSGDLSRDRERLIGIAKGERDALVLSMVQRIEAKKAAMQKRRQFEHVAPIVTRVVAKLAPPTL